MSIPSTSEQRFAERVLQLEKSNLWHPMMKQKQDLESESPKFDWPTLLEASEPTAEYLNLISLGTDASSQEPVKSTAPCFLGNDSCTA